MAGFDAHKNLAISAVATAPTPATSGTSLVVTAGHGARFPAAPFNVTIWPATAPPDPLNAEVARVTARATDTLTITRAQEGSTARLIGVGDLIAQTITAKTLTDLETRAALKDERNTFTAAQQLDTVAPQLLFRDQAAPVDKRVFDLVNYGQVLMFRSLNDAEAVVEAQGLSVFRDGGVMAAGALFEQLRVTAVGHPIPVPYSAANFYTYPAGTWTVPSGNVLFNSYTQIGKTLIYTFRVTASTVTAGVTHLAIQNPIPSARSVATAVTSARLGTEIALVYCTPGDASIYVIRAGAVAHGTSVPDLMFTLTMLLP